MGGWPSGWVVFTEIKDWLEPINKQAWHRLGLALGLGLDLFERPFVSCLAIVLSLHDYF